MNYYPVCIIIQSDFWSSPYRQTDRQPESDAYKPTVQNAQVGSKMQLEFKVCPPPVSKTDRQTYLQGYFVYRTHAGPCVIGHKEPSASVDMQTNHPCELHRCAQWNEYTYHTRKYLFERLCSCLSFWLSTSEAVLKCEKRLSNRIGVGNLSIVYQCYGSHTPALKWKKLIIMCPQHSILGPCLRASLTDTTNTSNYKMHTTCTL